MRFHWGFDDADIIRAKSVRGELDGRRARQRSAHVNLLERKRGCEGSGAEDIVSPWLRNPLAGRLNSKSGVIGRLLVWVTSQSARITDRRPRAACKGVVRHRGHAENPRFSRQ